MAETINQLLERIEFINQELPKDATRVAFVESVQSIYAEAMSAVRAAIAAAPAGCEHVQWALLSALNDASERIGDAHERTVESRLLNERALSDAQSQLRQQEMDLHRRRPRP